MLKCRKALVDKLVKAGMPRFDGYYMMDGKYMFCDGYRVYLLNEDAGYSPASLPFDLVGVLRSGHSKEFNAANKLWEYDPNFKCYEIDMDKLKAFIKDESNKYRSGTPLPYPITSEGGEPTTMWVNARYLLEGIELIQHNALKHERVIEVYNDGNPIHPIYVYSTDGEAAIILPVRHKKQD